MCLSAWQRAVIVPRFVSSSSDLNLEIMNFRHSTFIVLSLSALANASVVKMNEEGMLYSESSALANLQIDNRSSLVFPSRNLVGFTINVNFQGVAPSASQQAAFTNAAAAWMGRISGYRGAMSVPSITINATVEPDDGVGGTLGSAGPNLVSIQDEDGVAGGARFALVTEGSMNFDSADIDNLEAGGSLGIVIEHEMGHVLGIGTLWNTDSIGGVYAGTQSLYVENSGQFTGAGAVNQWQTEFGQADAFVPVELSGGPGTANGHWNEVDNGAGLTGIAQVGAPANDMRNELMTGWLNSPAFVSQMTLESLGDIGYTVIPEPSSALLVILGLALGVRRRR